MSLSPHSLTYGDSCFGSNALRRTLASFLTTYLKSREHIDPDHIVCIAGMTIAVEAAAMMLADPGDGLLLGRPYYPSFIPDVGIRAGYVRCCLMIWWGHAKSEPLKCQDRPCRIWGDRSVQRRSCEKV